MGQPALPTTTLQDVESLFTQWRATRQHKCRIPEELWTAAVRLSKEYSIHRISRTLRLSHSELKARAARLHTSKDAAVPPARSMDFIPIDISLPYPAECIVEMEHRNGNKILSLYDTLYMTRSGLYAYNQRLVNFQALSIGLSSGL